MPKKNGPMSVLMVIDSLGSGGAQRQIVWLAIGLAKRGHDVALFRYYPKLNHFRHEIDRHDIEILEVEKRQRFDLRPMLALRRIITSRHFDFVVSFLDTPNIYAILATLGNEHIKVVVSERFILPEGRIGIAAWLRFQLYRFADCVTVNSYHQRDRILDKFPWCRRNLFAIWNGVDISRFSPSSRHATKNRVYIRILAVATIVDWKNAHNLIRALALTQAAGAKLRIDWAGQVQQTRRSQHEFKRCQRLIEDLELGHEWRWLGVCEDMHQLYRNYDALVHPSFKEGLPNAICEALATGLPVLASNVCDHPLLIQDGINGLLFDPEDPHSIADALLKFARQSDTERAQMSHEARRFAESELGIDNLVEGYLRLLCDSCS